MKKLTSRRIDERKKKLQTHLRGLEKSTDMEQRVVDEQKEKWQQELRDIEQKRMISCRSTNGRRSGLKSCNVSRTKKKQCQKDAGKCDGELERVRDEIASDPRAGAKIPEDSLGRSGSG